MNQNEKKYAINRIQNIVSRKKSEAKDKFTIPAKELTSKQKYDLVASGKATLKPFSNSSYYGDSFYYDFSKFESREKFDAEAHAKFCQNIEKLSTEIVDKLMFGTDAKEALDMFKLIENFKV